MARPGFPPWGRSHANGFDGQCDLHLVAKENPAALDGAIPDDAVIGPVQLARGAESDALALGAHSHPAEEFTGQHERLRDASTRTGRGTVSGLSREGGSRSILTPRR